MLSTHGIGRVAVTPNDTPAVFPVNYTVVDDVIAYRTQAGSGPADRRSRTQHQRVNRTGHTA
uniref:pyridoxamine 5'-phosphate oxidase family protein n=1 Tax=Streptomyces noursei TaxID=1971 RepID=UPI00099FA13D